MFTNLMTNGLRSKRRISRMRLKQVIVIGLDGTPSPIKEKNLKNEIETTIGTTRWYDDKSIKEKNLKNEIETISGFNLVITTAPDQREESQE